MNRITYETNIHKKVETGEVSDTEFGHAIIPLFHDYKSNLDIGRTDTKTILTFSHMDGYYFKFIIERM